MYAVVEHDADDPFCLADKSASETFAPLNCLITQHERARPGSIDEKSAPKLVPLSVNTASGGGLVSPLHSASPVGGLPTAPSPYRSHMRTVPLRSPTRSGHAQTSIPGAISATNAAVRPSLANLPIAPGTLWDPWIPPRRTTLHLSDIPPSKRPQTTRKLTIRRQTIWRLADVNKRLC